MTDTLKNLPRPVRPVTLPGGGTVHVRDLTFGELRRLDRWAQELPEDRNTRYALGLCALALANPDGSPALDHDHFNAFEAVVIEVEGTLTVDQVLAIGRASMGDRAEAKNG